MSQYRAISHKTDPDMYLVQVRSGWWPFWRTFQYAAGLDRARKYAEQHAHRRPREVHDLGTFEASQ